MKERGNRHGKRVAPTEIFGGCRRIVSMVELAYVEKTRDRESKPLRGNVTWSVTSCASMSHFSHDVLSSLLLVNRLASIRFPLSHSILRFYLNRGIKRFLGLEF